MLPHASERPSGFGTFVGPARRFAGYGVVIGLALGFTIALAPLPSIGLVGILLVMVILARVGIWTVLPFCITTLISQDYIVSLRLNTPVGRMPIIIPILLVLTVFSFLRSRSDDLTRIRHVTIACWLYALCAAVSMLAGPSGWRGFEGSLEIVLGSWGVVLWTLFITDSSKALSYGMRLSVAVSSLVGSLAVTEYITGWNPYSSLFSKEWLWDAFIRQGVVWRAMSSIGNPLVLGACLVIITPVILAGVVLANRHKALWYIALAANLGGILSTVSRSIYLALLVAVVGIVLIMRPRLQLRTLVGVAALVSCTIIAMLVLTNSTGTLTSWVGRMMFAGDNMISYTHRAGSFGAIVDFMRLYPFGVGPRAVGAVLMQQSDLMTAHNLSVGTFDNGFLDTIGEVSLFGCISYVYLLVAPCFACSPGSVYRRLSVLILLVYVTLNFSFTVSFYWAPWVTYWTIQVLLIRLSSGPGTPLR